jgi:hypothetical protein
MMSTAILMTAGAEQTKVVRPVADDLSSHHGGVEGISFAKSFDERVGISTLSPGKSTADDAAIALQSVKSLTPLKKPDDVADIPGGVKGKDITDQKIYAPPKLKSAVAGKIIQVQAKGIAEPQDKATASDSEMKTVESPAPVEAAVDDLSSTSCVALAAGATDENPGPHQGIAVGDQSLISNGGRPVVQRETEAGEKVKEDVLAKRTAKAQESAATPKTLQKGTATSVSAVAVNAKPIDERLAEIATPIVGQAVGSIVALQGENSKAGDGPNQSASVVTKPSNGISPTTVDGQVRKEVLSGAKASVTDIAMMAAGSDPDASPKTDMSPEKMAAVAIRGDSNGENRPQAGPESSAVLSHSVVIAPAAISSGNTPGESAATKLPVGDAGTHTASLSTGSREQEGSGVVAQSMDGTPRMLTATPTSLEIGVQNGTHGWLKVRAEMTEGGVVTATVSAASSAGQEMLHRELPALTAYLQEEKVAVNALIVHAPSAGGSDPRSSSGMSGAGGQTPQRNNEGGEQHRNVGKTTLVGSDEPMTYWNSLGLAEDGSLPLAAYASGGSWLSVRA